MSEIIQGAAAGGLRPNIETKVSSDDGSSYIPSGLTMLRCNKKFFPPRDAEGITQDQSLPPEGERVQATRLKIGSQKV